MNRTLTGQFGTISSDAIKRASKYIVLTGDDLTDYQSIISLELVRKNSLSDTKGDILKYNLPEAAKTKLTWSINARSLQNLFSLRATAGVLWEFQNVALELFRQLPDDHKYLFEEFINLPLGEEDV